MKEGEKMKSIEEILNQQYVTARDLTVIIPNLSYVRSLSYIDMIREEMKEKGYFVPDGRTKVALTKIVKKKFGL